MTNKKHIKELFKDLDFSVIQTSESDLDFSLWSIDELEGLNKGYEVDKFLPNYFGIGSSGGGELLAIDLSSGILYSIPFIPMDPNNRIKIADSLKEFLKLKK